MGAEFLIADFFIDEPACLGVPPFMAPYPRYVFGALADAGIPPEKIEYKTADFFRGNGFKIEGGYRLVIIIGGAVVPGKYLGYKIGTAAEISRLVSSNPGFNYAVGGLISRILSDTGLNVLRIEHDIEKFA